MRFLFSSQESLDRTLNALQDAIMSTAPQSRYRPGWQSSLVGLSMSFLPTKWIDFIVLNWCVKGVSPAGIVKQRKA